MNLGSNLPYLNISSFQILLAIITLIIGWILVKLIAKIFENGMKKATKLPTLIVEFLVRLFTTLLYVLVILLAVRALGISVGPAVLGISAIIGLVLGFGMQDSLNNLSAGIWILALRPIDMDETVQVSGMTGKVTAVDVLATELLEPDNTLITIPNKLVWGSPIKNYTRMPIRRASIPIGVGYDSNLDMAIQVAIKLMNDHPLVLKDPKPEVVVTELADSSVNLELRAWSKTADLWTIKWGLTKKVLEEMIREGIEIPYPQLDVHMRET